MEIVSELAAGKRHQGFKQMLTQDHAGESIHYHGKLYDILDRAATLFAQNGYHNTSMRDLAAELKTSLAGLYYYFETKEELLFLISQYSFDSVILSLNEKLNVSGDPVERLNLFVHNHLQYFVTHLSAMKVLSHESDSLSGEYFELINAKKKTYLQILENMLLDIARTKSNQPHMRLNQEIKISALSLFGMMNWTYTWFNPEKHKNQSLSIQKISDQMVSLFLHGFLKN
ncbi:TetR family transcriptional regulator [bacterium]|nr:TetR family transcriptional regulator [bacterium]